MPCTGSEDGTRSGRDRIHTRARQRGGGEKNCWGQGEVEEGMGDGGERWCSGKNNKARSYSTSDLQGLHLLAASLDFAYKPLLFDCWDLLVCIYGLFTRRGTLGALDVYFLGKSEANLYVSGDER